MSAEQPADRVSLDALLAHRDWVRALARRLVLDENDADDVVQETWRMAIEKPPRHAGSPRGWLATVVRNAARMSGRSETRRAKHEAATPERAPTPSPADLVAAAEMQTRLARAVLDLDEPYRSTVLYRFNEGLETSEIATRLGVPVETVRTRLKRAIEKLRERMDVDLGDDRDAWCLLVFGVQARDVAHLVPTTAATASGAAAGIAGGLAMAATTKLLAAAAVLVAGAAWWAWPKSDVAPARDVETATAPRVADETPKLAPPRHEPRTKTAAADATTSPAAAEAPEIPLGPDVVHGRVIDDETEAPVAGVKVSLVWEYARMPEKELNFTTRADGTFRIVDSKSGQFGSILLEAAGYAECLVGLPWRAQTGRSTKNDAGDVRIFRGRRVVGRVLAADGKTPVAGARIRFSTRGVGGGLMWINFSTDRGASGTDGTFAIERVPPSHAFAYTVFAVAPGGVGWTRLADDAGRVDATGVDVVLRPNGAATVTVRDEAGAPKGGVRVVAAPRFEPLGPIAEWDVSHDAYVGEDATIAALFAATTDARGVARFTSLPTIAERPSYDFVVTDGGLTWKNARIDAGDDESVEIVVPAAKVWAIAGFVHAPDGTPIAGADVTGGYAPRKTKSGTDGRFRLEGLDPSWESFWFTVTAEGRVKAQTTAKRDASKDVVDIDVVLSAGAPVEGRVVDQDGKPVLGVRLFDVVTEADGKFVLPMVEVTGRRLAVQPPQPYDEWTHPGGWPIVRGGDKDVVVVLPRSPAGKARLVADVVDESGAPLLPIETMVIAAENDGKRASYPRHGKTELTAGRVMIERMKPGRWRLWVHVADRPAAVVAVDVNADDVEVRPRVVIGRGATLRGHVELGDTGVAMPRFVRLRRDEWTEPQWGGYRTADWIGGEDVAADGSFEFGNVAPGRWRLYVEQKGVIGETFVDVPSGGEVTAVVVLAKAAVLTIRLAGASPTDVVQCDVSQGGGPWRVVMRNGRVKGKPTEATQTLRPGTYRWRVTFPTDNTGDAIDAVPPVTGEVTLGVGESVVVDVPVASK